MDIRKRIKAFTLTEMLVVIVISAIIVSISLTVMDMVQKTFLQISNNYESKISIFQLEEKLIVDFNKYSQIKINAEKKNIEFFNPIDSLEYSFAANKKVVSKRDTIFLGFKYIEGFFNGDKVTSGEVDAIKICISNTPGEYIFVSKRVDAQAYLRVYGD